MSVSAIFLTVVVFGNLCGCKQDIINDFRVYVDTGVKTNLSCQSYDYFHDESCHPQLIYQRNFVFKWKFDESQLAIKEPRVYSLRCDDYDITIANLSESDLHREIFHHNMESLKLFNLPSKMRCKLGEMSYELKSNDIPSPPAGMFITAETDQSKFVAGFVDLHNSGLTNRAFSDYPQMRVASNSNDGWNMVHKLFHDTEILGVASFETKKYLKNPMEFKQKSDLVFMRPDNHENVELDHLGLLDSTYDWITDTRYVLGIDPLTKDTMIVQWRDQDKVIYRSSSNFYVQQIQINPVLSTLYFIEFDMVKEINQIKKLESSNLNEWSIQEFISEETNCNCLKMLKNEKLSPAITMDHTRNKIIFATETSIINSDANGCICEKLYSNENTDFWKIIVDYYGTIFWISQNGYQLFMKKRGEDVVKIVQLGKVNLARIYDVALDNNFVYQPIPDNALSCMYPPKVPTLQGSDVTMTYNSATVTVKSNPNCSIYPPFNTYVFYYQKEGDINSETKVTLEYSNKVEIIGLESEKEYVFSISLFKEFNGDGGLSSISNEVVKKTLVNPSVLRARILVIQTVSVLLALVVCVFVACCANQYIKRRNFKKYLGFFGTFINSQERFGPVIKISSSGIIRSKNYNQSRDSNGRQTSAILQLTETKYCPVTLKYPPKREKQVELFYREAELLNQLRKERLNPINGPRTLDSACLMLFQGVCLNSKQPIILLDHVPGGKSLRCFMEDIQNMETRDVRLNETRKLNDLEQLNVRRAIVMNVIYGLCFIHKNGQIMHHRLTVDSVVVNIEYGVFAVVKIIDSIHGHFSSILPNGVTKESLMFDKLNTPNPPEFADLNNFDDWTQEADLWMFGLLVSEIFGSRLSDALRTASPGEFSNFINSTELYPKSIKTSVNEQIQNLFYACLDEDPNMRGSIDLIAEELKESFRIKPWVRTKCAEDIPCLLDYSVTSRGRTTKEEIHSCPYIQGLRVNRAQIYPQRPIKRAVSFLADTFLQNIVFPGPNYREAMLGHESIGSDTRVTFRKMSERVEINVPQPSGIYLQFDSISTRSRETESETEQEDDFMSTAVSVGYMADGSNEAFLAKKLNYFSAGSVESI